MTYLLLALAIVIEVAATLLLKAADGVEKWWFVIASLVFYAVAGVLLALILKTMNVGLIYTIWSGAGIALVCIASAIIWQQTLDHYAMAGIGFIVVGTLLITAKSGVVMQ